jgi:hypothetical protein
MLLDPEWLSGRRGVTLSIGAVIVTGFVVAQMQVHSLRV